MQLRMFFILFLFFLFQTIVFRGTTKEAVLFLFFYGPLFSLFTIWNAHTTDVASRVGKKVSK